MSYHPLNWRNSRASVVSMDNNPAAAAAAADVAMASGSLHPGVLAPSSQRGSILGGTTRQSFMDWEPKNFRWSSLSDSLEPYGTLGPDPNATLLAQRLEQQMALNNAGGGLGSNRSSLNSRLSMNSRLSVMVQEPRPGITSSPLQSPPQSTIQTKNRIPGGNPAYPPGLGHIPPSSTTITNTGNPSWSAGNNASGANASRPLGVGASAVHLHHQPQPQQHTYHLNNTNTQQPQQQSRKQSHPNDPNSRLHSPSRPHFSRSSRPQSPASVSGPPPPANNTITTTGANAAPAAKSQDVVDFQLLKDIPGWLRTLRLHKYTSCFEGMSWQDVVELSDEQLTNKGIAALGARRKMLKVFENVKAEIERRGDEGIPIS